MIPKDEIEDHDLGLPPELTLKKNFSTPAPPGLVFSP